MRFRKTASFLVMLQMAVLSASCTPQPKGADDPKGRLNDYISHSFAVKSVDDRKALASFLTGDARARIEGWSDEQFRQAFIDSKRQFIKLAFKESKNVSPDEVSITYEITFDTRYNDPQGKPTDARITNRKLAQMVRKEGKWYVTDVKNIRELVEYKNELSLP